MKELKGIKIGKHFIEKPIIQGGMGVGISWDQLAGNVSKNGGLGTISAICTGYYQNMRFVKKEINGRPFGTENAYNREALFEIFKNSRKICGDKPLACNILRAINDYERVVKDALEAGADIIVTGAGLPLELPVLTKDYPDVAIVPIVSSARALKIICKKWKAAGKMPGAVIVEGPKSGGHQGAKYDELFAPEHQLEAILPPVKEERDKWGDFPIIECDASENFKKTLINAKEEDIVIVSSPVGYPGRAVKTNLIENLEPNNNKIQCISNCVFPCGRGKGARAVGYCIADSLGDAQMGKLQTGLFFSGANGYKLKEIVHVKDLIDELMTGEKK